MYRVYVLSNREFPKLFTENRVQTVTHVMWNGPSDDTLQKFAAHFRYFQKGALLGIPKILWAHVQFSDFSQTSVLSVHVFELDAIY